MNRPMFNALLLGSSMLLGTPLVGCGGGGSAAEPLATINSTQALADAASTASGVDAASLAAEANLSVAPSPAEAQLAPATTLAAATDAAVWAAAQAAEDPFTASTAGVPADATLAPVVAASESASASASTSMADSTAASTAANTILSTPVNLAASPAASATTSPDSGAASNATTAVTSSTTSNTTTSAQSSAPATNTTTLTATNTAANTAANTTTPSAGALTAQRSASAAQGGLADSTAAAAVSTTDIAVEARASLPFATQQWGNAQCNGTILASQKLPENGLQGSSLPGGQTLRFGRVADASTASGKAFQLTLHASDPITAGSHRCELAFAANATGGIPRNSVFWHAFAVSIPDWRGSSDEQAIAQWHAGDTSGGLLPVYTLLVRGAVMRLVLRYDTSATPSLASAKTLVVWSTTNWTPNRWLNFVTQAKVSSSTSASPFVKTWLNGTLIVNYSGPVGYAQPAVQSYAKHGIYHWVDATNPWDMALPTRTIRLKRPLIAHESNRKYSQAQIASLLNAD